jgi:hypothetical protein
LPYVHVLALRYVSVPRSSRMSSSRLHQQRKLDATRSFPTASPAARPIPLSDAPKTHKRPPFRSNSHTGPPVDGLTFLHQPSTAPVSLRYRRAPSWHHRTSASGPITNTHKMNRSSDRHRIDPAICACRSSRTARAAEVEAEVEEEAEETGARAATAGASPRAPTPRRRHRHRACLHPRTASSRIDQRPQRRLHPRRDQPACHTDGSTRRPREQRVPHAATDS